MVHCWSLLADGRNCDEGQGGVMVRQWSVVANHIDQPNDSPGVHDYLIHNDNHSSLGICNQLLETDQCRKYRTTAATPKNLSNYSILYEASGSGVILVLWSPGDPHSSSCRSTPAQPKTSCCPSSKFQHHVSHKHGVHITVNYLLRRRREGLGVAE